MTVREQFGANLRFHRQRVGYSQEKFAELAGLHRTEISLIERGKRGPVIETLVKLASVLGVSATELLSGILWEEGEFVVNGGTSLPPRRAGSSCRPTEVNPTFDLVMPFGDR